ncbi:carboxypeptidase-like regulatory domain-containing protein [Altibacter sp. HG106]|uniref:carboxypeptidase-like regulatory domain-containing protein n=1 Tax=Altibacter sp. HG106 TaxID=3023937 RepID=UPI002350D120|nr:carboxypeptidase-like regulatory domain-containing protein [Altibacter sp. HG106]MDC7995409.1 carboxypeptidase-like regulatory domain-containing protein [Altibacter sp. HG106]
MKSFLSSVGLSLLCLSMLFVTSAGIAQELSEFTQFEGTVVDQATNTPLSSVSLSVQNTAISTVTNSEGEFTLKVPNESLNQSIVVSLLGYQPQQIPLQSLQRNGAELKLQAKVTELTEVSVLTYRDPEALIREVFDKKNANTMNQEVKMTAFYRETIKRRNRNVSLTEAVVNLYKKPYASNEDDAITLHKARKSTDYRRLDTVALKLQGGPYSTLYLDIMKYPEYIFTPSTIGEYNYRFEPPTTIEGRPAYVVYFKQRNNLNQPHYEGKLFVDSESLALTSADYKLVIGNQREASKIFVKKKPNDVRVYPESAAYHVDYRQQNGKWHYSYGNVSLTFKVDKRRRLFNQVYTLSSEMAVTNWEATPSSPIATEEALEPSVVLADQVSGFSDPDFWGPYNVIEPEKSIESAIDKIQRNLNRGGQ